MHGTGRAPVGTVLPLDIFIANMPLRTSAGTAGTILVLLLIICASLRSQPRDISQSIPPEARNGLRDVAHAFIENRGQWNPQIRFAAHAPGIDLWISDSSILYDLFTRTGAAADNQSIDPGRRDAERSTLRRGHLLLMQFIGRSELAHAGGSLILPGRHNYILGNDPTRWAGDVPLFKNARIHQLYPGIDLLLQLDEGLPRYDFLVEPGADPAVIRFRFDGAESIALTKSGELAIGTSLGEVRQQKLFAYQVIDGKKRQVPCAFRVKNDGTVSFRLGSYDRNRPLVIDPLVYSTFLGGSGDDAALAVTTDAQGNAYLTGYAGDPGMLAIKFPVTGGAYQREEQGNSDVFVSKLNSSGGLVFSTFLGGEMYEDGRDIAVDGAGTIYVTGYTGSTDFPTTASAFSPIYNGGTHDIFVTRLSADGSSLVYSTFVGGSHSDAAYGLTLESSGNVRVCGDSYSADFPTTADAADRTLNGEADIIMFTLNATGRNLVYSTYIGGSGLDFASSIEQDASGRSCIFGTSRSADFPTTAGALSRLNSGGLDVVFVRLTAGTGIDYATYLGGSQDDQAQDLAIDGNNVILCGYTASTNFPSAGEAISRTYGGGSSDGFVTRFVPGAGGIAYSTYLGKKSDDFATAIGVDNHRYWIAGYTASVDFPYTLPAFDTTSGGAHDGFLMLLDLATDSMYYSTFIGGAQRDFINDMQVGVLGNLRTLYLCGSTASRNFPTRNAYQSGLAGASNDDPPTQIPTYDAFMTRLDPAAVRLLTQTPGNESALCPNSQFLINWVSFDVMQVQIDLLDQSGRRFAGSLLQNGPTAPFTWKWLVPGNQPAGTQFRIAITDIIRKDISDTGDIDFAIIDEPRLTRGITSIEACPGERVSFTLGAEGYRISYRWRLNHFTIFGAAGPTYVIDSVTAADTGIYEAAVYDACGSIKIAQTVTLRLKPTATIISQPVDVRSCPDMPVSFTVTAEGSDLEYQWYRNGEMVPGATSATLAIDSVKRRDTGYYSCRVTNAACRGTPIPSRAARLVVVYEEVVEQPKNRSVAIGDPVRFYVQATGLDPRYQWRRNGKNIPGATLSTYSISHARPDDEGAYDVIISGECEILSDQAYLTITGFSAVTGAAVDRNHTRILTVQPNPVTSHGVIRIVRRAAAVDLTGAELALYDMLGRRALDLTDALRNGEDGMIEFDAAGIPAGTYHCRLSTAAGITSCIVIIER